MKTETLSAKQQRFVRGINRLLTFAATLPGVELTFGDAYRDPRLHGAFGQKVGYGAASSCHKLRLAVDLNLFVDGQYITDGNHDAYKKLGEYWESVGGTWGGRFKDANHFSYEDDGHK